MMPRILAALIFTISSTLAFAQMRSGVVELSSANHGTRQQVMIDALHRALLEEDTLLERVVLQKLSLPLPAEHREKLLTLVRIKNIRDYSPRYTVAQADTNHRYVTQIAFRRDVDLVKQHLIIRYKQEKQPPYAILEISFPGEQELPGDFLGYVFPPVTGKPLPPPPPLPTLYPDHVSVNLYWTHRDSAGHRYLVTDNDDFCGFAWYLEHEPAVVDFLDAFGLPYRGRFCWPGPDSLTHSPEDLARFEHLTLLVTDIRELPRVDFAGLGIKELHLKVPFNTHEGEIDLVGYGGNLLGLEKFSISGPDPRRDQVPLTLLGYRRLQEEYGRIEFSGKIRFR